MEMSVSSRTSPNIRYKRCNCENRSRRVTYHNSRRLRRVWIVVDGANRGLFRRLTAPPACIRNEEELLLGKAAQTWKHGIGRSVVSLLPRVECRPQTAGIGNVLTQGETTVHVEWLGVRSGNGEVGILIDEALGPLLKGLDGSVVPPICVVACLVVMSACRVES